MNVTLRQLSMAVSLLEHANDDYDFSIKDAFAKALSRTRPELDSNGIGIGPSFNEPRTIFDQDKEVIRPGEPTVREIILDSDLRDQIVYWAEREQARKDALANSNVNFVDVVLAGLKAIFDGPSKRTNDNLSDEDKVLTGEEVKAEEEKKRKEAEARDRAETERKQAAENEARRRAEEERQREEERKRASGGSGRPSKRES